MEEEFSCLDYVVIREAVQKKTKQKNPAEMDSESTYLPLAEGRILDKSLFWESKAASLKVRLLVSTQWVVRPMGCDPVCEHIGPC